MIGVSKLLCDASFAHDPLRYGQRAGKDVRDAHKLPPSASERKPVVVWNMTRTCNLRCIHCYTDSEARAYEGELPPDAVKAMLEDLADFGIPALLFSGGEPLVHPLFWEHAATARELGLRCVLSTNATLITKPVAERLSELGLNHVGASLDGIGDVNDHFRGKPWAYERAVEGIRNCKEMGIKVSLRMTLTKHNAQDLDGIFELVEREGIERLCFYHLAYSGRGRSLVEDDQSLEEARATVSRIFEKTQELYGKDRNVDVLTVDNHCDGPFLYLRLMEEDPERAEKVRELLEWNGGGANSSGVGIGDIDFNGDVHADQFWMDYAFGNVKERPFSEIWTDLSDPIMAGLKDRLPLLKGRCGVCRFQKMCGGSLRVRAWHAYGDAWAEDPACYLTDEEIGVPEGFESPFRREAEPLEAAPIAGESG
jgi:radical SAM protein with 4Fe4S-binding SPASM domain